ncbi:Hypothetical predicted protein [Mytilus galloprovincialis]|uniref:Mab-21-like HhH/H2TH-like domain-containing protein n=1 Tax=Mytilus galloprovincialis TaxID=29158 RepID=A0A8B6C2R4_MYTGA|nr:Hypothetical predicted protein [Mytilus galloprovincialis]
MNDVMDIAFCLKCDQWVSQAQPWISRPGLIWPWVLPKLKMNIHGPCLSDINDLYDFARCLKWDHRVSQAQPWISRSRLLWSSPELISKITSCGTLFVPIGNKGSVNENLQWRISFSVAEKVLIYSFSHTQLLCYALFEILLKEIVNEMEELTGLLCSYFLKTLMFLISEENETTDWRPDNIIPCFMACLKSGSKGEGLDLKGSDFDIMILSSIYVVYESDKDVVQDWRIVLVMDTEETPPCFTQLKLCTNVNDLPNLFKQQLQQHRGKHLLSSELYKSKFIHNLQCVLPKLKMNIHGPCLSDIFDLYDFARCLKCDHWVSQAQPWISRSRLLWPSPELISKITSCGTLFVPIGNKGSINENLQWRISLSVAEKILIYSFSHTQLLCYALLKILVKEIVNGREDLKGLLCSYFLKTLMFWISEENKTTVWRPDNIIPCFMACIKRLSYCIEYSTLLHYFIPDNNLFYLRFNNKQRNTLINFLRKSYQKGIRVFSSSQTLRDYRRFQCETTRSVCEINLHTVIGSIKEYLYTSFNTNSLVLLFTLLNHCKSELSRCIFTLSLTSLYQQIPFALPHVNNPNNKQQYKFYKHDLSQLLVGVQSDAVSGWLILASFFYGHNNYLISIDIINYTLSKYTDESFFSKISLKQTDTLKLISRLPSPYVVFRNLRLNSVIPMELKSHHFYKSSRHCMNKLLETVSDYSQSGVLTGLAIINNFIVLGIACQMLGETYLARKYFRIAAQRDVNDVTSAAFRLRQFR